MGTLPKKKRRLARRIKNITEAVFWIDESPFMGKPMLAAAIQRFRSQSQLLPPSVSMSTQTGLLPPRVLDALRAEWERE